MNNSDNALKVDDLVIRFGGLCAIDNVSMHINKGEFVGLIGPNLPGRKPYKEESRQDITHGYKPYVSEHTNISKDDCIRECLLADSQQTNL